MSNAHISAEEIELIGAMATRRLDEDVQPLVLIVDQMPPGAEKAAAMSHLHSIIGGLCSIRNLVGLEKRRRNKLDKPQQLL